MNLSRFSPHHLIVSGVFYCLFSSNVFAAFSFNPSLNWRTLQTEHFAIHFHQHEQDMVRQVALIAERTHDRITRYFDWTPRTKTQLVLIDRMDFNNGSAASYPDNIMTIIVSPPDDVNSLLDNHDNYLEYLITHEYAHIVHLDKAAGAALTLRQIFGRFDWLLLTPFPNAWQPPWVIEGIATHHESQLKPGTGRGNNNFFRGMMRNEIIHGLKPIRQVNQPTTDWPMGNTRYLYGVYFFDFIKQTRGEQAIKQWIDRYSDNLIPFMLNSSSQQAFGKPLDALWLEFEHYLHIKFATDIERRNGKGLTKATVLSDSGYLTGFPRSLPNGDIYFTQTDYASQTKLMLLKKGAKKAVQLRTVQGERFDLHAQKGVLFAEQDRQANSDTIADLYHYDLTTLRKKRLTTGRRYVAGAWHPDGNQIIAVHNHQGNKRLDRLSADGEFLETLWAGQEQENISNPQWSPDGQYVLASVWRDGYWNLEKFDLDRRLWESLTNTTDIEIQAVFSMDGNTVIFSADYDGAFNIYSLDLRSGDMIQQTNVLGGAIAAAQVGATQDIVYMDLSKQGYNVYYAQKSDLFEHVITVSSNSLSKALTQLDDTALPAVDYSVKPYNGLKNLAPKSWFPYVGVSNEQTELGLTTFGSDPLLRHQYSALLAYDWKNDWAIGGISYIYDRWNPAIKIQASRDVFTLRNTQGELAGFANSDSLGLELVFPVIKRDRQWAVHLGYVLEKETSREKQNPSARDFYFEDERVGLALSYNSARRYPRSISSNDGQTFRLIYENSEVSSSGFNGQTATLDWRAYSRLPGQQVLATRLVYGYGLDDSKPFSLGGVNNGFTLPGSVTSAGDVFDRRSYALRGYPSGLKSLRGRRMALLEAEWRFPIYRLERGLMVPPVGLHQLSGSVFYNAGSTWQNSIDTNAVRHGAGLEVNSTVVLGYNLRLNFRLGYAKGFDDDGEEQVYFKLGQTF